MLVPAIASGSRICHSRVPFPSGQCQAVSRSRERRYSRRSDCRVNLVEPRDRSDSVIERRIHDSDGTAEMERTDVRTGDGALGQVLPSAAQHAVRRPPQAPVGHPGTPPATSGAAIRIDGECRALGCQGRDEALRQPAVTGKQSHRCQRSRRLPATATHPPLAVLAAVCPRRRRAATAQQQARQEAVSGTCGKVERDAASAGLNQVGNGHPERGYPRRPTDDEQRNDHP